MTHQKRKTLNSNVEQESSSDEEQIIADEYEEPAKNDSVKSDFNTNELENHAKEESVDQSDIKDVEIIQLLNRNLKDIKMWNIRKSQNLMKMT